MAGFLDERGARAVVEGIRSSWTLERFTRHNNPLRGLKAEHLLIDCVPIPRRWGPPRYQRVTFFNWLADRTQRAQELCIMRVALTMRGELEPGTSSDLLFVVLRHAWERLHQRMNSTRMEDVYAELTPAALALTRQRELVGVCPGAWLITPRGAGPVGKAVTKLASEGDVPVLLTWLADDRTWPSAERRLAYIQRARRCGQVFIYEVEEWQKRRREEGLSDEVPPGVVMWPRRKGRSS